jgi:hypothetical protein
LFDIINNVHTVNLSPFLDTLVLLFSQSRAELDSIGTRALRAIKEGRGRGYCTHGLDRGGTHA